MIRDRFSGLKRTMMESIFGSSLPGEFPEQILPTGIIYAVYGMISEVSQPELWPSDRFIVSERGGNN
jgi:hypothetical protein